MKFIKNRYWVVLAVAVLVFGGLWGFNLYREHAIRAYFRHYVPPPVVVATAVVRRFRWWRVIRTVGSVEAVQTVSLSPDLPGQVTGIFFHSGQFVRRGTRLIALNDAEEEATLHSLEATVLLDKLQYQRQKTLLHGNLTARSSYDTARAAYLSAKADAASESAVIANMQVVAPFSGRLGIRLVNLGQYLTAGTAITTLTRVAPLYVSFHLPEQDIDRLYPGQVARLSLPADPGRQFYGRVAVISPTINSTTRLIHVLARFQNTHGWLKPGMFGRLSIRSRHRVPVTAIPRIAVSYSLYGDTVWAVDPPPAGKKFSKSYLPSVRQVFVKPAFSHGGWVAIAHGLSPGMEIVTQGQIKLHKGDRIRVDDQVRLSTHAGSHP